MASAVEDAIAASADPMRTRQVPGLGAALAGAPLSVSSSVPPAAAAAETPIRKAEPRMGDDPARPRLVICPYNQSQVKRTFSICAALVE